MAVLRANKKKKYGPSLGSLYRSTAADGGLGVFGSGLPPAPTVPGMPTGFSLPPVPQMGPKNPPGWTYSGQTGGVQIAPYQINTNTGGTNFQYQQPAGPAFYGSYTGANSFYSGNAVNTGATFQPAVHSTLQQQLQVNAMRGRGQAAQPVNPATGQATYSGGATPAGTYASNPDEWRAYWNASAKAGRDLAGRNGEPPKVMSRQEIWDMKANARRWAAQNQAWDDNANSGVNWYPQTNSYAPPQQQVKPAKNSYRTSWQALNWRLSAG